MLLYAWNPLVIKEIAFTAHSDGVLAASALLLAYATGLNLDNDLGLAAYDHPYWLRPVEFGLQACALGYQLWTEKLGRPSYHSG